MKTFAVYKSFLVFLFSLFAICQSFSQTANWVWLKGYSSTNNGGYYGSIGVPLSTNIPGARYLGVNWTDSSGNLWMFGGSTYNSLGQQEYLNDLWRYNIATNTWTWMNGDQTVNRYGVYGTKGVSSATNKPGSRKNGVGWTDKSGNLWMYGGYGFAANSYGYLTDLWKYNVSTNEWTWVNGDTVFNATTFYGIKGIETSSNKPGSRYGSAAWCDNNNNFWLFGGYGLNASGSAYGLLNDLWKYNVVTNRWTWVGGADSLNSVGKFGQRGKAAADGLPSARNYANGFTDNKGKFWLFGGACNLGSGYGWRNDLWSYNLTNNSWTWESGDSAISQAGVYGNQGVPSLQNKPGARSLQVGWSDKLGNLWIWGGYGYTGNSIGHLNDFWMYNISSGEWTWQKGDTIRNANGVYGIQGYAAQANTPGAREIASSWTDRSGQFWLFGGYGYSEKKEPTGVMNDLWKFSPEVTLPVHLLNFKGQLQGDKTILNWAVTNEFEIVSYTVERSVNGVQFYAAGAVETSKKSSSGYFFYDDVSSLETAIVYYRLKVLDKNGKFRYSNIVVLKLLDFRFYISPNPAYSQTQLHFAKGAAGALLELSIMDATGKLILKRNYNITQSTGTVAIAGLASGTYFAKVLYKNKVFTKRFLILK